MASISRPWRRILAAAGALVLLTACTTDPPEPDPAPGPDSSPATAALPPIPEGDYTRPDVAVPTVEALLARLPAGDIHQITLTADFAEVAVVHQQTVHRIGATSDELTIDTAEAAFPGIPRDRIDLAPLLATFADLDDCGAQQIPAVHVRSAGIGTPTAAVSCGDPWPLFVGDDWTPKPPIPRTADDIRRYIELLDRDVALTSVSNVEIQYADGWEVTTAGLRGQRHTDVDPPFRLADIDLDGLMDCVAQHQPDHNWGIYIGPEGAPNVLTADGYFDASCTEVAA